MMIAYPAIRQPLSRLEYLAYWYFTQYIINCLFGIDSYTELWYNHVRFAGCGKPNSSKEVPFMSGL